MLRFWQARPPHVFALAEKYCRIEIGLLKMFSHCGGPAQKYFHVSCSPWRSTSVGHGHETHRQASRILLAQHKHWSKLGEQVCQTHWLLQPARCRVNAPNTAHLIPTFPTASTSVHTLHNSGEDHWKHQWHESRDKQLCPHIAWLKLGMPLAWSQKAVHNHATLLNKNCSTSAIHMSARKTCQSVTSVNDACSHESYYVWTRLVSQVVWPHKNCSTSTISMSPTIMPRYLIRTVQLQIKHVSYN